MDGSEVVSEWVKMSAVRVVSARRSARVVFVLSEVEGGVGEKTSSREACAHTRTHTHTHAHTDTRTHGHADTRTHGHTDTRTH